MITTRTHNTGDAYEPAPAFPEERPSEEAEQAKAESSRIERLRSFASTLSSKRREAVNWRVASGVESRWREDENAYHGRDGLAGDSIVETAAELNAPAARNGREQQPVRARTFVQLTRQKTNAAAARLGDMLFPSDDRNWLLKPTPVPELVEAVRDQMQTPYIQVQGPQAGRPLPHPETGDPVTLGQLAIEQLEIARRKCAAMEKEMDDQLMECQYNHQGRLAIMDAARLGTGIIKGPVVHNRTDRKWKKGITKDGKPTSILEVFENLKPGSARVDPWDFYPAPGCGEDIHNGEFVWERERVPGRKLRELARTQGYIRSEILACLQEGPQHLWDTKDNRLTAYRDGQYLDNGAWDQVNFEVWTYTGDARASDLATCGLSITDDPDEAELMSVSAMVVMCNDRPIKVMLNPMDTGDFPYDVFPWETVSLSPFGVGIPYLMRYAQATINAAWRMMLDNAAVSHGPQVVVNRQLLRPVDKRWEITGRKLWETTQDADGAHPFDAQKAFHVFQIDCNQPMLQQIIELGMKFADEETSLPQIAQGERGTAPDTVGGMSILMNSANTVLRRLVKQWDDRITRPHLRRYYDWNMQYNPKEEIKGDYQVDARGSTALMVRDQQQQALIGLMSLAPNPEFGKYINKKKLFEAALKAQSIDPNDIMHTDDEVEQIEANMAKQPPPMVPVVEAAKIRAASAERLADKEGQLEERRIALESERMERDDERNAFQLRVEQIFETGRSTDKIKADLAKLILQSHVSRADQDASREHENQSAARKAQPQSLH